MEKVIATFLFSLFMHGHWAMAQTVPESESILIKGSSYEVRVIEGQVGIPGRQFDAVDFYVKASGKKLLTLNAQDGASFLSVRYYQPKDSSRGYFLTLWLHGANHVVLKIIEAKENGGQVFELFSRSDMKVKVKNGLVFIDYEEDLTSEELPETAERFKSRSATWDPVNGLVEVPRGREPQARKKKALKK